MVSSCVAYGCTNRHTKRRRLSFHLFPKDPLLKRNWVTALRRANFTPSNSSALCGEHFKPEDYIQQFGRIILKEDAVPSIFNFKKEVNKGSKKQLISTTSLETKSIIWYTNPYCAVPYCKTGCVKTRQKISLFTPPVNPELFDRWVQVIPITRKGKPLTFMSEICALHFHEEEIMKCLKPDGITIDYRKVKLTPGAVPSIFPQPLSISEIERRELTMQPEEIKIKEESSYPPLEFISIDEVQDTFESNVLFNNLYKEKLTITLPNESWALHRIIEKYICISNTIILADRPVTAKQILISDNLVLKFFIHEKEIIDVDKYINFINPLQNTDELEEIVNQFDKLNICVGGPSPILYPTNNISTNIAKIDHEGNWRHNKCSFIYISNGSSSCNNCFSLHTIFALLTHGDKKEFTKINPNCQYNRYQNVEPKQQLQLENLKNRNNNLSKSNSTDESENALLGL